MKGKCVRINYHFGGGAVRQAVGLVLSARPTQNPGEFEIALRLTEPAIENLKNVCYLRSPGEVIYIIWRVVDELPELR